MSTKIKPQPKQREFLRTNADIAVYGGAAGAGKTWSLLLEPLYHLDNENFRCVIFRRTIKDLKRSGGLIDESYNIYPKLDGEYNKSERRWSFPSGATVTFQYLSDDDQLENWQGAQIPLICWDELTHFSERQFFYLLSRNRSVAGIDPYVRATCNPDPDHWLRGFLDWWVDEDGFPIEGRSGQKRFFVRRQGDLLWSDTKEELIDSYPEVFRDSHVAPEDLIKSITFIPASIYDNEELLEQNPQYLANLKSQPKKTQAKLLSGNWDVKREEGDYFKRDYFEILKPEELPNEYDKVIRAWDMAETEPSSKNRDPDYTVGMLIGWKDAILYVLDVIRFRKNPSDTEKRIVEVEKNDKRIFPKIKYYIERPPGAGKTYIEDWKRKLKVPTEGRYSNKSKSERANPVSRAAGNGMVKIKEAAWNETFLRELTQFGLDPNHDDQVDSLSLGYRVLTEKSFSGKTARIKAI